MNRIDREDMLELTRRMTPSRTHFTRIAGAYMDEEGYVDGTFNTSFRGLSAAEKEYTLAIAKEVVFAETNVALKKYRIPGMKPGSFWQMFYALCQCDLKNDALLLDFYELIGEKYPKGKPYAIYLYHGVYDIPVKAADHERLDDSVEVYSYLILAISPQTGPSRAGLPDCGFLYPAFTNRISDPAHIDIYSGGRDFLRAFLGLTEE